MTIGHHQRDSNGVASGDTIPVTILKRSSVNLRDSIDALEVVFPMISLIQARLSRARKKVRSQEPSKKPVGLIYGRDDVPPLGTMLLLGLQHAAESASKVALATGVLVAIGAPADAIETMIAATLMCSGFCCILIAQETKPFGYGYLAPAAIMSSFVAPSLVAARAGGLPLMAGMTLVTGTCVIILSRLLHRW